MPAKLNIGLSRKVGEANYSSRGASVHLEVELDSGTIRDRQLLRRRVRALYAMARRSVEEELSRSPRETSNEPVHANGNGHRNGQPIEPPAGTATQSQVRAIFAIARDQRLNPLDLIQARFHKDRLEDLSIREASSLIDDLKRGVVEVRT